MKSKLLSGLAAGIALVYCTLTGLCQNISPDIHFLLVHQTLIVVPVMVNGQGPFDFIMDTGNDITIMEPTLGDQLGLKRSGHMLQVSVMGGRTLETSTLTRLAMGTAQTENVPVLLEDLAFLRQISPHIQGVVGQEFLSHFNYLLDYGKRTIRVESGSEVGENIEGSHVPLELIHDRGRDKMIITADMQALHHTVLRLALDSGATDVVLMKDASQRLQVPIRENMWQQTPAGSSALHSGPVHLITIGTEQLRDVRAVTSSETAVPFGDGLLPTSLFQALYFNNREGFVVFNPRTKGASAHK